MSWMAIGGFVTLGIFLGGAGIAIGLAGLCIAAVAFFSNMDWSGKKRSLESRAADFTQQHQQRANKIRELQGQFEQLAHRRGGN